MKHLAHEYKSINITIMVKGGEIIFYGLKRKEGDIG